MSDEKKPTVIDVSHNNGIIDFVKVKSSGILGVICKATQGETFIDHLYAANSWNAIGNGMMLGAYHFGTGGNVEKQVNNFLDEVSECSISMPPEIGNWNDPPRKTILLALDYETNTTPNGSTMSIHQCAEFIQRCHDITGRWIVLYGGILLKNTLHDATPDELAVIKNCPLWLSQYGSKPVLPSAWDKYTLWQYSSSGKIDGVSGRCDVNVFNGSNDDLKKFWGY